MLKLGQNLVGGVPNRFVHSSGRIENLKRHSLYGSSDFRKLVDLYGCHSDISRECIFGRLESAPGISETLQAVEVCMPDRLSKLHIGLVEPCRSFQTASCGR
jgi:hypothetical protein